MGYIQRVKSVTTCRFLMARTKIPTLPRLLISVDKASGSEGADHCAEDGVCVCDAS